MNQQALLFDVDGTLTPSRHPITTEMKEFFTKFCMDHDVYLVSGSDYAKTIEQLGQFIVEDLVTRSYNCSGNSVWENGKEIYSSSWVLPQEAVEWLENQLERSSYPIRTGKHIEHRPGAVNFSIVGRNADRHERAAYVLHDLASGERNILAEKFNINFGPLGIEATVGGETGLDITEKGKDKRQVLKDFEGRNVCFFGDRCDEGGNDYPLSEALLHRPNIDLSSIVYYVTGWEDTLQVLKRLTFCN